MSISRKKYSNPEKKKLLLLGGIRYLLPVIKVAHDQGYFVITADYCQDNIAHKYSDEFVNVSIIDQEAVLEVAREKKIDGIMSFGVDPGVISASYVQYKMGLPSFAPYESAVVLQNKDRFRAFLAKHGFNVPKANGYCNVGEALADATVWKYPVMVKPTDSAGSKGVTRVDMAGQLEDAVRKAFSKSVSGHVIIEDFIEKTGYSSDSDCMVVDGKLAFVNFNAQRFDDSASNPYTPSAYSWPSTFSNDQEAYLTSEIQRLITLLGLKTAVLNVETQIGTDGIPYIMEMALRGGGNRLCEMLQYAAGVDLITAITRASVGDPLLVPIAQKPSCGHWAEIILHSNLEGRFHHLEIGKDLPAEIIEEDLWVNKGDEVKRFDGANNTIGTLVLKFQSDEEMEQALTHQSDWLRVIVR